MLPATTLHANFADLPGSDLGYWHKVGIGKTSVEYALALTETPRSTVSFAQRFRVTSRATRHHLNKLEAVGLAVRTSGRYRRDDLWARGPKTLEQVATERGAVAYGQGKADQYTAERTAHRAWVGELRETDAQEPSNDMRITPTSYQETAHRSLACSVLDTERRSLAVRRRIRGGKFVNGQGRERLGAKKTARRIS